MTEVTYDLILKRKISINGENLRSHLRIPVIGPDCMVWRRVFAEKQALVVGGGFGFYNGWRYEIKSTKRVEIKYPEKE